VNALRDWLSSLVIGVATAIVIVTASVVPFLTPQWIAFEQGRANATAWTGYSAADLRIATDAILVDLVFGPPDFDVEVGGEPVLVERERGHMRDVRSVFIGLWALAGASGVILGAAAVRGHRPAVWRAARRGALTLAAVVVLLGVAAVVAFESLFEVFHRVFFPAGSYTFDPATERLVQLFPFQFWQETAVLVGIVIIALSLAVATTAGRRTPTSRRVTAGELTATPEPSR
jgi:integral membrane protein (TIGR01906 family)